MAQVDKLLQRLTTPDSKVICLSDQPMRFQTGDQSQNGPVLPANHLESMVLEVLPAELEPNWEAGEVVKFSLATSYGPFQFTVRKAEDGVQVAIEPAPRPQVPEAVKAEANLTPLLNSTHPPAPALSENNSGQGAGSPLPDDLHGFNWGGFLLSWIWAIGNSSWIGLLALVPCLGLVMRFVLGFKGNQLAWAGKRWQSKEDFRSVQRIWAIVGAALIGVNLFSFFMMAAILFPVFARARENARRTGSQSNLRIISAAASQYAQQHGGVYPPYPDAATWQSVLNPGQIPAMAEKFLSPCNHQPYAVNSRLGGFNAANLRYPAAVPTFYETTDESLGGRNVAFADGHVRWYKADKWPTIQSYMDQGPLTDAAPPLVE